MKKDQVVLTPIEFRIFNEIQSSLKGLEPSTSNVNINSLHVKLKITEGLIADAIIKMAKIHNILDVELEEDDELDSLEFIYLNDKKLKKVEIIQEEDAKVRAELKKKYTKYTTPQLQIKYPTLKGVEKIVCAEILEKRGMGPKPNEVIDTDVEMSEKDLKKIADAEKAENKKTGGSKPAAVPATKAKTDVGKVLNLTATPEQKAIIEMEASKAEKIRRLFDTGLSVNVISKLASIDYVHVYDTVAAYRKRGEEAAKQK